MNLFQNNLPTVLALSSVLDFFFFFFESVHPPLVSEEWHK